MNINNSYNKPLKNFSKTSQKHLKNTPNIPQTHQDHQYGRKDTMEGSMQWEKGNLVDRDICNIFHSKINLAIKPFPFDIIAKHILQNRANTKRKNGNRLSTKDIIQTAIDKFPQFGGNGNGNGIDIAINKCKHKQVGECESFLRVNYILYHYQLWTASKPSTSKHKYAFHAVINQHNYNNSQLLDDAQHLHLFHEFHDIYTNITAAWQCNYDLNECRMFLRNNNARKNSLYFDVNDERESNVEQLCDILHCYLLHSYDLGFIFCPKQKQQISQIVDADIMNGETLKLAKIADILRKKQCKIWNSDKYMTLIEQNQNLIHYEYFNKDSDYYVTAICDTLKSELLANGIAMKEWNKLQIRAVNIQQKEYSKLLSASCGSIISSYHIISLLVVCNFAIIRSAFMKTFLCSNNSRQSRQKLIRKHSHFALFGKILIESVHIYGERRNSDSLPFYHCFNKSTYFASNVLCIPCPLSICTNIRTILKNNSNNTLITCKLNENSNYNLKYFDCAASFVSDWSAECELFMIENGNCPLTKQIFKIEGIMHGSKDYSKWLISIEIIIQFITGWNYDISQIDKEILRNVENILIEMANNNNKKKKNNNLRMPEYAKELMFDYVFNIYEIEIDWFYLNTHYSFLRSFLCFNRNNTDFISLNILLSAFKNCKKISIHGGVEKKLKLDRNIMRYLYEFLLSNTQSIDLKEIVVWNFVLIPRSGYNISLKQLCGIFERKFQKIHWILVTESQSVIFKRDC